MSALSIFWLCVGLVAGEYLLYHLALLVVRHRPLPAPEPAAWPPVVVLIAAYNEADTIAAKIENVLAADYPADRLQVIVGDDGSKDGTVAIVEGLRQPSVRVERFTERRGKIHVQRDLLRTIDAPVVVFTDATVRMGAGALKHLVRHFGDDRVGGVSARIHVANLATTWLVELHRLLFQIQNAQKAGESRLDSAGGLYGQLCAVRTAALGDVSADVVYEDREFGIRLRERGYRVRVDDEAAAAYLVPETVADFRAQKSRVAGAITQSIARHWRLLFNPAFGAYGLLIFPEYALFRALRQPLLAGAAACLLVALVRVPLPAVAAHAIAGAGVLLLSFWSGSLCLLPYVQDRAGFLRRLVTALPGLALLVATLAVGSVRFLRRGQTAAWTRIHRPPPDATDPGQPEA